MITIDNSSNAAGNVQKVLCKEDIIAEQLSVKKVGQRRGCRKLLRQRVQGAENYAQKTRREAAFAESLLIEGAGLTEGPNNIKKTYMTLPGVGYNKVRQVDD